MALRIDSVTKQVIQTLLDNPLKWYRLTPDDVIMYKRGLYGRCLEKMNKDQSGRILVDSPDGGPIHFMWIPLGPSAEQVRAMTTKPLAFYCTVCGSSKDHRRGKSKPGGLEAHYKLHEDANGKYPCPRSDCDYVAGSFGNIRLHCADVRHEVWR